MCVEESVHVIFDETNSLQELSHENDFEIGLIRIEESVNIDEEPLVER